MKDVGITFTNVSQKYMEGGIYWLEYQNCMFHTIFSHFVGTNNILVFWEDSNSLVNNQLFNSRKSGRL